MHSYKDQHRNESTNAELSGRNSILQPWKLLQVELQREQSEGDDRLGIFLHLLQKQVCTKVQQ